MKNLQVQFCSAIFQLPRWAAIALFLLAVGFGVDASAAPSTGYVQDAGAKQQALADEKKADEQASDEKKQLDEKSAHDKSKDDGGESPKAEVGGDQGSGDKKAEQEQAPDKDGSDDGKSDNGSADKGSDDDDPDDSDDEDSDDDDSDSNDDGAQGTVPFGLPDVFGRDARRENSFSKRSDDFVAVFEPIAASADASTVSIVSGRRQIALGTVVGTDGLVLTKASELKGEVKCKLGDGKVVDAKVIGVHQPTDLALLKVAAENLNVVQWSSEDPRVGLWVASPKSERERPKVGVISVSPRAIPPSSPFIGITWDVTDPSNSTRISSIIAGSPADDADLWVNDVITQINDSPVKTRMDLVAILRGKFNAGDRVTLHVLRGGKPKEIKLTLAERDKISPENSRSNTQNSMGSVLSQRRKNFPESFQHDSPLTSRNCGGPIVDISGKAIGLNIARAGRVSSLALTVKTILPVLEQLKSGELVPSKVNQAKIVSIDEELKEIEKQLSRLPSEKIRLESKYNVEYARKQELGRLVQDLKKRGESLDESVRAASLAMTLDAVAPLLSAVEAGRVDGSVLNQEEVKKLRSELDKLLESRSEPLPEKASELSAFHTSELARKQENARMVQDLESRYSIVTKKADEYASELRIVKRSLDTAKQNQRQLAADRRQLATGIR